jgi:hypothetical protein
MPNSMYMERRLKTGDCSGAITWVGKIITAYIDYFELKMCYFSFLYFPTNTNTNVNFSETHLHFI